MKLIIVTVEQEECEVYTIGCNIEEQPPEGVPYDEFNLFQITEMFRGVLRVIVPSGEYRLDITRHESSQTLPMMP